MKQLFLVVVAAVQWDVVVNPDLSLSARIHIGGNDR